MSRRKQSKPRQIKRSLGDLDGGEENTADTMSLSGEEGGASDPEDSAEGDSSTPPPYTPLYSEVYIYIIYGTFKTAMSCFSAPCGRKPKERFLFCVSFKSTPERV